MIFASFCSWTFIIQEADKSNHSMELKNQRSENEGLDFTGAFILKYVHATCLSVIRYMILLCISSTYSKEPWCKLKDK